MRDGAVAGMGSAMVCITGYKGIQKSRLIALIRRCGALYSADLTSRNTHLICWSFSGDKYILAKKRGKLTINHRWLEDSLEAGRRLSEDPYTHKCGEEVGPVNYKEEKVSSFKEICLETAGTQTSYVKELDLVLERAALEMNKGQHSLHSSQKRRLSSHDKENLIRNRGFRQDSGVNRQQSSTRRDGKRRLSLVSVKRLQSTVEGLNHSEENREQFTPHRDREKILQVLGQESTYEELLRRKGKRKASSLPNKRLKQKKVNSYLHTEVPHSPDKCERPSSSAEVREDQRQDVLPEIREETQESDSILKAYSVEDSLGMFSGFSNGDVQCVICHTECKSTVEGILHCGHEFCFDCIKRWSHHSEKNTPTCPLCKAPFEFITKRESFISLESDESEQKFIETVVMIREDRSIKQSFEWPPVNCCIICRGSDTEDLLLICNCCHSRAVHTFCLDPPWSNVFSPWVCNLCYR